MQKSASTRVVIGLAGLVVVVVASVVYQRATAQPQSRQVKGTIVSVDAEAGRATLAIVHPKTGKTFETSGQVPPECKIVLPTGPGTLADLSAGQSIEATCLLYTGQRAVAQEIRVLEGAATETPTPAAPSAGEPGGDAAPAGDATGDAADTPASPAEPEPASADEHGG